MRIARPTLPVVPVLALLAILSLSACDYSEQNYDLVPGDSLSISGPSTVTVSEEATYNIFPFTVEKEYNWSVDGPGEVATSLRRDGEYFDVTFEVPGTYTVTVDDGEYTGTLEVVASSGEEASQAVPARARPAH